MAGFGRRRRVRDELIFHRDRLIAEYLAAGMGRQAAERRAALEFGNIASLEESSHDVRGRWFGDGMRDAQYAARALARNPLFAIVAVTSLALAIGANATIFSLVNAVLLRPLNVADPGGIVQITRLTPEGRAANVSYPLFEHLRDNVRSIAGAFAHGTFSDSIVMDGEQEFVTGDMVTGRYFDVLGLAPAAGRLLGPVDDDLAAPFPAAVISTRYWQRRFGGSGTALGRTFVLRDRTFTIVGVMPASFDSVRVGSTPDVVVPLVLTMPEASRREPTNNALRLLARLKPDATVDEAAAEAAVLWKAFIEPVAARVPGSLQQEVRDRRVGALPAPDGINPFRDDLSAPLLILTGVVACMLLLATVNVAGLLMARAAARQREISIRLAIGAARGRLVRQFLAESLVLATIGGTLGLALAFQLSRVLAGFFLDGRDLELTVTPDWRVALFTVIVSLVACLLAGLAPALQTMRGSLNPGLKEVTARRQGRLSRVLVTTQFAISMMLVVGATLFVGSLVNLYAADRGFDTNGVAIVNVRTTAPLTAEHGAALVTAVVDRLRAASGVTSAGAAQQLPLSGNDWTRAFQPPPDAANPGEGTTAFNAVTPGYFSTLRTPIVAGRDFDPADMPPRPPVAIVNERFARNVFGDQSALGRRVTSAGVVYEIVGVARDALYSDLREGMRNTMYAPWSYRDEQPASYKFMLHLAEGGATMRAQELDRLLREVDRRLRVRSVVSYSTLIDRSIPAERILATLGGLFGALALVMAGIGMFALLAFQVARRTNELGVRVVLGATRASMVRMIIGDVAWTLFPGLVVGGGAAFMVTGLAQRLLFGLTPNDPAAFGIAASVLTFAALAAAWLPARRACRVDPLIALRHE